MAKKKKLPKPANPDAQYCSTCPYCLAEDTLHVESGMFCALGMRLSEDGFAFVDADQTETSDEMVCCSDCHKSFPLSEVTR